MQPHNILSIIEKFYVVSIIENICIFLSCDVLQPTVPLTNTYYTFTRRQKQLYHRRLVQHASRLLSPLPFTVQVPASRAQVLSGCSQWHTCDWHIRNDVLRGVVTGSVAR